MQLWDMSKKNDQQQFLFASTLCNVMIAILAPTSYEVICMKYRVRHFNMFSQMFGLVSGSFY